MMNKFVCAWDLTCDDNAAAIARGIYYSAIDFQLDMIGEAKEEYKSFSDVAKSVEELDDVVLTFMNDYMDELKRAVKAQILKRRAVLERAEFDVDGFANAIVRIKDKQESGNE